MAAPAASGLARAFEGRILVFDGAMGPGSRTLTVTGGDMAIGSIAGGLFAARLAVLPAAKVWVFRLLVVVIVGELIPVGQHDVFGLI